MAEGPGERDKLTLQYAAENRRNEIALLWSRSLYFWGFITVLLTAFGASYSGGHKTLAFLAACFGFLASLAWSLANRSSKYWQTVWEEKVQRIEGAILSRRVFNRSTNPDVPQRWFWGAKEYSPSKLATALSDFSVVGWIILATGTVAGRWIETYPCYQVGIIVAAHLTACLFTSCAALTLLIWCRSGDPLSGRAALRAIWFQRTKIGIGKREP